MKFNLEIGGSEGELKELIEILQQLAEKPHIQSAVESNELENQVYMANREARKKRLLRDAETAKERADQESAPAPEPEPKSEPKAEPAEEPKKEYTYAEVSKKSREFMDSLRKAGKDGTIAFKEILNGLGYESAIKVPKEKYPDLMEALSNAK